MVIFFVLTVFKFKLPGITYPDYPEIILHEIITFITLYKLF